MKIIKKRIYEAINMEWYYELDFEDNPFEVDPLISDFNLIGREKEANEILYRILSGNMLLVEGKEGELKINKAKS